MRKQFFGLLVLVVFLSSCQQEVDGILPEQNNTGNSNVTRLKEIKIESTDPANPGYFKYKIQYDTAARKISVFFDNTLSGVNNLLYYTYQFNSDGYLVGISSVDNNNVLSPLFLFTRNSSNQIQQIVQNDFYGTGMAPVISYFTYLTAGGQQVIKDSTTFSGGGLVSSHSKLIYFNSNTKPTTIINSNGGISYYDISNTENYVYNSAGELTTIFATRDTTSYVNDHSQVSTEWSNQGELFLGKDAYLLSLLEPEFAPGYNFLTFGFNSDIYRAYDPLFSPLLSSVNLKGWTDFSMNTHVNQTLNVTNEFTPDHKISKITINTPIDFPTIYSFTYY